MSHAATNWAIGQRGLDPAAKIILWHLADCHNPAKGCFPTQAYLAAHAELSRASVNRHLAMLEARGLIVRERRFDKLSHRQLETRYYLACEADFAAHCVRLNGDQVRGEPCLSRGQGAVSQKTGGPSLKSEESRVSGCDTNPVREPVKEPPPEAWARGGAAIVLVCGSGVLPSGPVTESDARPARDRAEDGREAFECLWCSWPELERPKQRGVAARLFRQLTLGERQSAVRFATAFRSVCAGRGGIGLMIPYLRDRLFLDFVDGPAVEPDGHFRITRGRPEWRAWIAARRDKFGVAGVRQAERLGYMLTPTRWPGSRSPGSRDLGQESEEDREGGHGPTFDPSDANLGGGQEDGHGSTDDPPCANLGQRAGREAGQEAACRNADRATPSSRSVQPEGRIAGRPPIGSQSSPPNDSQRTGRGPACDLSAGTDLSQGTGQEAGRDYRRPGGHADAGLSPVAPQILSDPMRGAVAGRCRTGGFGPAGIGLSLSVQRLEASGLAPVLATDLAPVFSAPVLASGLAPLVSVLPVTPQQEDA